MRALALSSLLATAGCAAPPATRTTAQVLALPLEADARVAGVAR